MNFLNLKNTLKNESVRYKLESFSIFSFSLILEHKNHWHLRRIN